jgi:uncharacterized protein YdeI (BOF family)
MLEMSSQFASQRTIEDVKPDDNRVQITGHVQKVFENDHFILNDETGEIKVNIKDFDFKFNKNDLINVIGDLIIQVNGEKVILADIVQDMNKLNFSYYVKLYNLRKELE